MNDYLISDLHFHHRNIIEYTGRPFKDVEEMNETLIKNWNSVVKRGDRVFLLGDVFFCSQELAHQIKRRLNGDVYLFLGNHDKHSKQWFKDIGFIEVFDKPFIMHNKYIISHKPLEVNFGDLVNVHGHVHNRTLPDTSRYCNVSVEEINYTPILFNKVRSKHEGVK